MSILVIAEHDNSELRPVTRAVLAAAQAISNDTGSSIDVLVAGSNCGACAAEVAKCESVSKVLHADHPAYEHQLAENIALLVADCGKNYSHILAPHTTDGKNFMPRVAGLLGVAQVSDLIAVSSPDTFARPIYAGNAIATVQCSDAIKVLTVRGTAFDLVAATRDSAEAPVTVLDLVHDAGISSFVDETIVKRDRPELTAADIVISGGRGMKSSENFKLIEAIADKLNAAIGASRAAVDAGFVPNDMQVGQTGKIVAPDLYIAVGISGAIQHLAGMKDSKVVVAINKDEDAPIFQVADYGLVADLFEVMPELESKL